MSTKVDTCELWASRLLDGDTDQDVMAHVQSCPECSALARDISAFVSLVERARNEIDVPSGGARLRLVQTQAGASSSGQPAGPALPGVVARRRIAPGWPTLVAIAAMLVGVVTVVALLDNEPPRTTRPERAAMREAGEKATSPTQSRGQPDERPAAPTPDPTPTLPPAESPQPTRDGRPVGPKDGEWTSQRRETPGPAPSHSATEPALQSPELAVPEPDPQAEALAHRTLTGQLPRLRRCYERALRRDLRMRDAHTEISVDIAPDGSVQAVQTTGETQSELRQCLEQTLRTTRFPVSDGGIRLSVPLRFELVRGERMGSNVRRPTE